MTDTWPSSFLFVLVPHSTLTFSYTWKRPSGSCSLSHKALPSPTWTRTLQLLMSSRWGQATSSHVQPLPDSIPYLWQPRKVEELSESHQQELSSAGDFLSTLLRGPKPPTKASFMECNFKENIQFWKVKMVSPTKRGKCRNVSISGCEIRKKIVLLFSESFFLFFIFYPRRIK